MVKLLLVGWLVGMFRYYGSISKLVALLKKEKPIENRSCVGFSGFVLQNGFFVP